MPNSEQHQEWTSPSGMVFRGPLPYADEVPEDQLDPRVQRRNHRKYEQMRREEEARRYAEEQRHIKLMLDADLRDMRAEQQRRHDEAWSSHRDQQTSQVYDALAAHRAAL
jgi:hypothetical protein